MSSRIINHRVADMFKLYQLSIRMGEKAVYKSYLPCELTPDSANIIDLRALYLSILQFTVFLSLSHSINNEEKYLLINCGQ